MDVHAGAVPHQHVGDVRLGVHAVEQAGRYDRLEHREVLGALVVSGEEEVLSSDRHDTQRPLGVSIAKLAQRAGGACSGQTSGAYSHPMGCIGNNPRSPRGTGIGILALVISACQEPSASVPVRLLASTPDECDESEDVLEGALEFFEDLGVYLYSEGCELHPVPELIIYDEKSAVTEIPQGLDGEILINVTTGVVNQGDGTTHGGFGFRLDFCTTVVAVAFLEPFVFAHELGHTLGLDHDDRDGNLMGPYQVKQAPWLDEDQVGVAVGVIEYVDEECR